MAQLAAREAEWRPRAAVVLRPGNDRAKMASDGFGLAGPAGALAEAIRSETTS
jgi:hypothetical protein